MPIQVDADGIGKFRNVTGEAYVVRDGDRSKAVVGGLVFQKDVIETAADGAVGITFNDNTVFSTGPNSHVSMEVFEFNPVTLKGSFLAKLGRGTLSVVSGDIARGSPSAMRIKTPSAILGVRGTRFLVRVIEEKKRAGDRIASAITQMRSPVDGIFRGGMCRACGAASW